MNYSMLMKYLEQKRDLTDLEKDILDTWNELQRVPFDCQSAQKQIVQNNAKYPQIYTAIAALPTTVVRPFDRVTESDLRYNLERQFAALAVKEGWQTRSQ